MKLKFDSTQQFQIDAVNSIVDLFAGQPLGQGDFSVTETYELIGAQMQTELGIGNCIRIDSETILNNIQGVRDRNDLEKVTKDEFIQNNWEIPHLPSTTSEAPNSILPYTRPCYNFSVEMETGTGKTYVYLRTIFELATQYSFKKFIIVVPSVAIREGTLKNLEITREHFSVLYNNLEYEYFVYDSKKANRLRQFAASNHIQIMVINIDAFRKDFSDSEDDKKSNVIFKEMEKLSGRRPIEFVQATVPIVIIDEPQSVDNTSKAQDAIRVLNPLCILRYSATHKKPYNLVYRLDPIKAYQLKLVKQITIATVKQTDDYNDAFVRLVKTDNKKGFNADVMIHIAIKGGVKEKKVKVKQGSDLFVLSGEREIYRHGYEVVDISVEPGNEWLDFSSGRRLALGAELGGSQEDLAELKIHQTIVRHLDRELQFRDKGIKVLSLFFLDRVSNYRSYDAEGKPQKGQYAFWFEKHYNELISLSKYKILNSYPVEKVHDGYFAQDKKGVFKNSSESRSTKDDEDTYAKIMRNKEQLLSLDEPLRFIFSHSALREGWDNPNVFQICSLNEARSVVRKRQEIGRGLRLPVNQNGERVFDNNINKLLVIGNESYEDFARALQNEYEEDCGVTFGKVAKAAFAKLAWIVDGEPVSLGRAGSEAVWEALRAKGYLDENGKILASFNPKQTGFNLGLGDTFRDVEQAIIETVESYHLERFIKKDEDPKPLKINKQVFVDPEFEALWDSIKGKTTYEVQYSTNDLIENAVKAIRQMEKIEPVRALYSEGLVNVEYKGVTAEGIREKKIDMAYNGALPDIMAYLQKKTELTRATLAKILIESGRLVEFGVNPQAFMDKLAAVIGQVLHRFMVDGIKYERIAESEWNQQLFKDREVLSYLNNRLDVQKSVYDAVVYDSDTERKFAVELDRREDIKLFVKLPSWFKVDTPIGEYNPDWAIVKQDDETIYLVRETKATKNFEQLRVSEADKIRCGRKHFEALGANYEVVISANEV